jgi:hypothetical protein
VCAALLLTVLAGGLYAVAQQVGRVGADDVPRAVAALTAERLDAGLAPKAVVGGSAAELTSAASPFVIVFNAHHEQLASDATVQGQSPTVPAGVLDIAATDGSDHVTWQPAQGVREAVFARPWRSTTSNGVVVAGIGLGPTEDRAARVRTVATVAWAAGLGILVALFLVTRDRARPGRSPA